MMMFGAFALLCFLCAQKTCATGEAHAYIDLGTGSLIFQVFIGILFGGLFAIKLFWHKIKAFLIRLFSGKTNDQAEG